MNSNICESSCRFFKQVSNFKCKAFLASLVLLVFVSFWGIYAKAQQRCESIFSQGVEKSELQHLSSQHFDLFILGTKAKTESDWWSKALNAVATSNSQELSVIFQHMPVAENHRAIRLLMLATDRGVHIPERFNNVVERARAERDELRSKDMEVEGELSAQQMKDLTNIFTMLGIRRSKVERLYQRLKLKVGLESAEYVPVIQAGKAKNILGDEARLVLREYNLKVSRNEGTPKDLYKLLVKELFEIYQQRVYQTIKEPWFTVDGQAMNLNDFIVSGAYRQEKIAASNTWMNVVRLDPDKVQNPMFKGHVREMWWNRGASINPIGTVRIARNMLVDANGKETLVSVEVLRRGEDGIFVPYLFEADITGQLRPKEGNDAIQKMKSCIQCHLRLSGILFGGITMPNYKAVNDWHINNIDFTKRSSYEKFKEFR